jgi:hypothetical protein
MITKIIKDAILAGSADLVDALTDLKDTYESHQDQYFQEAIPADAAAGTFEKTIFTAPYNCIVKEVKVVPDADIGQETNYMVLDVQSKGADGTGTTSLGSRNVNSANPIEGFVGVDLLTEDTEVTEGHSLSLEKTVQGDGQAFPGGLVLVKYEKA